jgi:CubicO group peptidase (beta-lactamase class C family)
MNTRSARPATVAMFTALAFGSASGAAVAAAAPLDTLDAEVRHAMAVTATPGVAVAIVKDGEPLYIEGFGLRRVASPQRVDGHTLFAIGSLTKAFTATDIAMLVDQGAVGLDVPVKTYVPAFMLQDSYRGQNATVRDLLAHRTGIGDTNWLTVNTSLTPDSIVERLAFVTPDAGFRETYLYQNTMYMVLGQVIKNVSGLDWATFTEQRVLGPLGMRETMTHTPGAAANAATPHVVEQHAARVSAPLDITNVAPAGAMYSSASDLAKWLAFQAREGGDDALVSPRLFQEMHSPQFARKADPYLYPYANFIAYGLAWILWDYHGLRVVSHDGAIDGMTAKICMVPALGLGIVVLANAEYSAVPNIVVYDVLDRLAGDTARGPRKNWEEHFVPLVATLLNERAQEAAALRAKITADPHVSHAIAGSYMSPLFGVVTVTQAARATSVQLLGRQWPLLPLTDGNFAVDAGSPALEHARFGLHFGTSPADPALTISVGGHDYVMKRVP